MRRKVSTDRQWLIKHLKPLMVEGKNLFSLSSSFAPMCPSYEKGYWTALKLILLKYYIKLYLDIQGSQRHRVAYVDLFAGPGLNLIGDRKMPILGSPFIPIKMRDSKYQFSALIFSDINGDYIEALNRRLELCPDVQEITKTIKMDANQVINDLPSILSRYDITHSLVFIDPEGMELKWKSLNNLVETANCDLIINFPSVGIHRNLKNLTVIPTIQEFLGPGSETIPHDADEEWAIRVYRDNLARIGKDISTEIAVKSGDAFHYHLIPAVRKTSGGSPWFKAFLEAKQRIEKFTGEILGVIAEQIDGKMGTITDF